MCHVRRAPCNVHNGPHAEAIRPIAPRYEPLTELMMILNVLLCATTLVAAAAPQKSPNDAEIQKREQQRIELLTGGKLDELAAMLSPTLSYTHSSAAIDDKTRFLETLRSGQVAYKSLVHRDVQVRFPTPDVAIMNGLSDIDVSIGGKLQQVPVRFTIVYVRQKGVWLLEAWQSTRRQQN